MSEKKRVGLALCGSYCTYEKLFAEAAVGLGGGIAHDGDKLIVRRQAHSGGK